MKSFSIAIILLFTSQFFFAQINAVTGAGDEVLLFDNGTWEYVDKEEMKETVIETNPKTFVKGESLSFLVKSTRTNVGIWLNPKKWSFSKGESGEDAEFSFQLKGEDLYAMLISEKMEIPLETLREIALDNAKSAAPDIRISKEEYRNVNGKKVLMLQMKGTIQGIKFVYYGYYYSNSKGTLQLLTYTGESLLAGYQEEIELFLNGLVALSEE